MDTLRLLFSVHGSLFLHWPFFIGPIASSVSRCFKVLLRSVPRYPLWFYLGEGFACLAESSLSLCTFVFYSGCLSGFGLLFLVFPSWLCVWDPLPSFLFLPGFFWSSLLVGVVPFLFLCFSSRSAFLSCLLILYLLSFAVFFFPFLHELLGCFLPWFGVSPFRVSLPSSFVSQLVPLGLVLPLLIPVFSFGLFFVSLVNPLVLLASPLDLSLACSFLVPLLFFFSPPGVPCSFVHYLTQNVLFLVSLVAARRVKVLQPVF